MVQAQGVQFGTTFLEGSNIRAHQKAARAVKIGVVEPDLLLVRHSVDLGGYSTRACVIADGSGRTVAFSQARGQAHELSQAIGLLERLPGVPRWVLADHGHTSHTFHEHIGA